MLGAILDEALRPRFGDDYPWTLFFDRLGIETMTMELDRENHHVGGAYSYLQEWLATDRWLSAQACRMPERTLGDTDRCDRGPPRRFSPPCSGAGGPSGRTRRWAAC